MLRDITIGQYYQTESFVHRLDPRTKLAGTMFFLIAVAITKSFVGFFVCALFLTIVIKIAHVPFRFIIRGLKSIAFLLILSIGFCLFFEDGRVVFQWRFIRITYEGIRQAFFLSTKIILMIIGSSLMTLTTTPNLLTDGLEKGLGFLKKVKIPVHDMALMMSIALRFIPVLIEETDKIMKAQMARGANFESKNVFKRIVAMIPLFVPLFVSAIRRALDLATAMEARCYHGGEGRTKMKPLSYRKQDAYTYMVLFLFLAILIAIRALPIDVPSIKLFIMRLG